MNVNVVDVRHDVADGWTRVNVSRMATARDDEHARALGNPFRPTSPGSTLRDYRAWATEHRMDTIAELAMRAVGGERIELACWCGGAATCHANVVRELMLEVIA